MRELPYSVLNVFAERALEGNPLCVFHDGRGLSDERMQALARETNLSETTFVLPAGDPANDPADGSAQDRAEGVRVRIFTTEEELPFAGHPTLGTASWLRSFYPPVQDADTVTLRLNSGPIAVRFDPPAPGQPGVFGTMGQRDPQFGAEYPPTEVAAVLGLPAEDLLPGYRPQTVSTGNPFCIVALRSLEALGRLTIPQQTASAWLRARGIRWFYCVAPEPATAGGTDGWRARMQWGSGEDPATGSAAGPCIGWLVRQGLAPAGVPVTLRQGVEMQRPSRLTVQASQVGERLTTTLVGGRTILVASGRFFLPD